MAIPKEGFFTLEQGRYGPVYPKTPACYGFTIRRGGTYGPPLPEGAPDDGAERGIAAFVGCASLVRQFEFAQNVWVNDRSFHELNNERDPIIGNQDGTLDYKIPKRPIRKTIKGLPAFTTVRGGAYFFLPGIKALHYLARSHR